MVAHEPQAFLGALVTLFETTRDKGSVFVTFKKGAWPPRLTHGFRPRSRAALVHFEFLSSRHRAFSMPFIAINITPGDGVVNDTAYLLSCLHGSRLSAVKKKGEDEVACLVRAKTNKKKIATTVGAEAMTQQPFPLIPPGDMT